MQRSPMVIVETQENTLEIRWHRNRLLVSNALNFSHFMKYLWHFQSGLMGAWWRLRAFHFTEHFLTFYLKLFLALFISNIACTSWLLYRLSMFNSQNCWRDTDYIDEEKRKSFSILTTLIQLHGRVDSQKYHSGVIWDNRKHFVVKYHERVKLNYIKCSVEFRFSEISCFINSFQFYNPICLFFLYKSSNAQDLRYNKLIWKMCAIKLRCLSFIFNEQLPTNIVLNLRPLLHSVPTLINSLNST